MPWLKTKELENDFNAIYEDLVPASGRAGTVRGEVFRAVARISYRFFNDGDMFFEGYGIETVSGPMTFLTECEEIPDVLRREIEVLKSQAEYVSEKEYEDFTNDLTKYVVDKVDEFPLTETEVDMFDFESEYEEYENRYWDDECYY